MAFQIVLKSQKLLFGVRNTFLLNEPVLSQWNRNHQFVVCIISVNATKEICSYIEHPW